MMVKLISLITVAALLMLIVLAAEFGIDPTGLGRLSGITGIHNAQLNQFAEMGSKRNAFDEKPFNTESLNDEWHYELAPFESVEFKYTMPEGGEIDFNWSASSALNFDFHAHPFEGGESLTESYKVGEKNQLSGHYQAGFEGLHGWYWQNRHFDTVLLTLKVTGDVKHSIVYSEGRAISRQTSIAQPD